jgi:hypothetical protein
MELMSIAIIVDGVANKNMCFCRGFVGLPPQIDAILHNERIFNKKTLDFLKKMR